MRRLFEAPRSLSLLFHLLSNSRLVQPEEKQRNVAKEARRPASKSFVVRLRRMGVDAVLVTVEAAPQFCLIFSCSVRFFPADSCPSPTSINCVRSDLVCLQGTNQVAHSPRTPPKPPSFSSRINNRRNALPPAAAAAAAAQVLADIASSACSLPPALLPCATNQSSNENPQTERYDGNKRGQAYRLIETLVFLLLPAC
ncbi:hypothetical protein IWZ01DRAFT_281983 [Phyllosticta capitalensis]